MGSTLHWREGPERPAGNFEMDTAFGRGKGAGTGFLAYSNRAGPGVLVLCHSSEASTSGRALARALSADGFTALLLDLAPDHLDPWRRIEAAADYLVDNWHPRLGIVCLSTGAELAARLAAEREVDAVVLNGDGDDDQFAGRTPLYQATDDSQPGQLAAVEHMFDWLHYNLS